MSKTQNRLLIIILLLAAVCVAAASIFWSGSVFRKVSVSGYVYIPKQGVPFLKGVVDIKLSSKEQLFEASLENWRAKRPLEGVEVRLAGKEGASITDDSGYFQIYEHNYRLKEAIVLIEVPQTGQQIKVPINNTVAEEDEGDPRIFVINIQNNGGVEASVIRTAENDANRKPVLMVHGFGPEFGPFELTIISKKWDRAKKLLQSDADLYDFDFFSFEYPDDQTIVFSSKSLSRAILRLNRIYEQPIKLLAFSAGGLVCRHYLISEWYAEKSVDKLLMVGTPNHGADLAIMHFDFFQDDGDGAASDEILPGSEFLMALNNQTAYPSMKQKFHINEVLQDERGLNPEVQYRIIAGEVIRHIKEEFEESEEVFMDFAVDLIIFLNEIFSDGPGKNPTRDEVIDKWKKTSQKIDQSMGTLIDEIPPGDLIVPLESALMQDVPHFVLPYSHGKLIMPEDMNDERYLLIKQFLVDFADKEKKQVWI